MDDVIKRIINLKAINFKKINYFHVVINNSQISTFTLHKPDIQCI